MDPWKGRFRVSFRGCTKKGNTTEETLWNTSNSESELGMGMASLAENLNDTFLASRVHVWITFQATQATRHFLSFPTLGFIFMYEITSYLQHLQPHPHLERSEGTSGQCRNWVPNSRESKSSKAASCNTSLSSFSPQQNIQYQSPKKNPTSCHPESRLSFTPAVLMNLWW